MATPHITGLAALVLAHHPDFTSVGLQMRNAARVDHLFNLLTSSATPLQFGDPQRSGAGLPDSLRALGRETGTAAPPDAAVAAATAVHTAMAQLGAQLMTAGILSQTSSEGPPEDPPLTAAAARRGLAELRAQMLAAGLKLVPSLSTSTNS